VNVKPTITVMTSREFNQDTARAKRAARLGPVFITERGRQAYVLISKEEHERLKADKETGPGDGGKRFVSLAEALEQKEGGDFDFEIPEFKGDWGLKIPGAE
jgi:PHD/YefM family antitoxin component YafN of YafNO toxin-antitoxin module